MKQVLVTGATGNVGRQVVAQLLESGAQVRALTRTPETANLPAAVDVVGGDLTVPETLTACLDGVEAVFLVWVVPAATAATVVSQMAQHAQRIVLLTSPHQTPHPFFQQPNPLKLLHAELERLIQAAGVQWTFLRPGMFAANALSWWAPQIRVGNVVRWPYADAPTAPIHERDIAAVGVRALLEEGHDKAEYVLTGPDSLSQREQVQIIGEVLGRSLRFEDLSAEEARHELAFPRAALDMLLSAWAAAIGQPALVTTTVAALMGRPTRTFRDWVLDHVEEFRQRDKL